MRALDAFRAKFACLPLSLVFNADAGPPWRVLVRRCVEVTVDGKVFSFSVYEYFSFCFYFGAPGPLCGIGFRTPSHVVESSSDPTC